MTGHVHDAIANDVDDRHSRRERKRGKTPSLERGIRNFFMGLGFLFVSLALSFAREGRGWWYWMLLPAFSMIGGGVAEYMRSRNAKTELAGQGYSGQVEIRRAPTANALPAKNTSDLVAPPPSVTEGTTRHLGAESPTRVFVPAERPKQ
jgi:hypothetical protein